MSKQQQFYSISQTQMEACLFPQGFQKITLVGTVELVYGKIVKHEGFVMSLRVYTGINPNGVSRGAGQDAIRVQLYWKYEDNPVPVGRAINVRRIPTWEKNLNAAIGKWSDEFKVCQKCGSPMVIRNGRNGEFWGCVTWKVTKCSGKAGESRPTSLGPTVPDAAFEQTGLAPVETPKQPALWERLGMGKVEVGPAPATVPMNDRMRAIVSKLRKSEPVRAVVAPAPKPVPTPMHPPVRVGSRNLPPSKARPGDPMDKFRIPASKISAPQKRVETLFLTGETNLLLVSRAGGGKTTLLKHLASYRKDGQRATYLAFNSKNAAEGRKKLPREVPSQTTHSFLKRVLKEAQVAMPEEVSEGNKKNWAVMEEVYPSMNNKDRKRIRKAAFKLIGLAKNFACLPGDRAAIKAVMDQYTFEVQNEQEATTVIEIVDDVLKLSVPGGKFGVMFDFDDMIWWPVVLDLMLPKLDFVLLDEVQDFNACQLWMVKKLMERGCRAVAVGDPFQAVYRFRGADADAFDKLRDMMGVDARGLEEVLLPVNYRSGKAIIAYVREHTVVKDIEAAPDAIEGLVRHDMSYDQIIDFLASEYGQPMAV